MKLPPGSREVDPVAETEQLAKTRDVNSWPVTGQWLVHLPNGRGGTVLARISVAAQKRVYFAEGAPQAVKDALAGQVERTGDWS